MTPAIQISKVSINRGARPIIHEASLQVPAGRWFGLVGANGSGKTTLLRAIAGRLPIADGTCLINGASLQSDREQRAHLIGFAPPIEHLPASLSIDQLLVLAGDPLTDQRARNGQLWEALGIDDLLQRRAGSLSSGMKQRAAIAIAFAYEAPIVILDEPFNWLDPVAALECRAALAEIVKAGTTLVTALHDMTTLCGYCDSGALLSEGQVRLSLGQEDLIRGRADPLKFEADLIAQLK